MKKIFFILFILIFPFNTLLAQSTNVGFVPGNIWYSIDPFKEGDSVEIYTFIFNPDQRELSGAVLFFDKSVLLGRKEFKASSKEAQEVFISWKATAGDHEIFAKIENAKFLQPNGTYQEVYIADNETERSERKVSKSLVDKILNEDNQEELLTKVEDIGETILDKTPNAIKEPVLNSTSKIEEWRNTTEVKTESKKDEIKNELARINLLEENGSSTKDSLLKPFKYVELFFFNLLHFILDHKLVFYGVIITGLAALIRLIFTRFF